MRTISSIGILVVGGSLVACGGLTVQQRIEIAKVEMNEHAPAENCQNLGTVEGARDSQEAWGVRAKAVKLGGNTVYIDVRHGVTTAFYCPPAAEPEPAPDWKLEEK